MDRDDAISEALVDATLGRTEQPDLVIEDFDYDGEYVVTRGVPLGEPRIVRGTE